jgi:hypothetical protein
MRSFIVKNHDTFDTLITCAIIWSFMQVVNTLSPEDYSNIVQKITLSLAIFFTFISFYWSPLPFFRSILPRIIKPGDSVDFTWSVKSPYTNKSLVIHTGKVVEVSREPLPGNYLGSTGTYDGETFWIAKIIGKSILYPSKEDTFLVPLWFLRKLNHA